VKARREVSHQGRKVRPVGVTGAAPDTPWDTPPLSSLSSPPCHPPHRAFCCFSVPPFLFRGHPLSKSLEDEPFSLSVAN